MAPREVEKESTLKIISFKGRELPSNYRPTVIVRWLRSLKQHNIYFDAIDQDSYFDTYDAFIKQILSRPGVQVKLAAWEKDIDVIFGWSVVEGDVLHYVHVSDPYRKQGIAKALIPKNVKWITHLTKQWDKYFDSKKDSKGNPVYIVSGNEVKFNPFKY